MAKEMLDFALDCCSFLLCHFSDGKVKAGKVLGAKGRYQNRTTPLCLSSPPTSGRTLCSPHKRSNPLINEWVNKQTNCVGSPQDDLPPAARTSGGDTTNTTVDCSKSSHEAQMPSKMNRSFNSFYLSPPLLLSSDCSHYLGLFGFILQPGQHPKQPVNMLCCSST